MTTAALSPRERVAKLVTDAAAALVAGHWETVHARAVDALAIDSSSEEAEQLRQIALAQLGAAARAAGERRQMTVMFTDLKDSTPSSGDVETFHEALLIYQEVCADVVRQNGGYIAKYMGDGIMILFGYPEAHEDDARNAVRAGMMLTEAFEGARPRIEAVLGGAVVRLRIGIHTGEVVAAEVGAAEWRHRDDISGETPAITARLEGIAEPGTVCVSEDTARLVSGFFEMADLGAHEVKGVDRPLRLFRPLSEHRYVSRFDQPGRPRGSLVGRHLELARLEAAWGDLRENHPQRLCLVGDAGVGKTRLAREFADTVRARGGLVVEGRADRMLARRPFHPLAEALTRYLDLPSGADEALHKERLRQMTVELDITDAVTVPALAALLGAQPRDEVAEMIPSALRAAIMAAAGGWLTRLSSRTPVLLLIEDLHWADPSTIEFVQWLAWNGPQRLMVLMTSRESPDAAGLAGYAEAIALDSLSDEALTTIATGLLADLDVEHRVVEDIVARSEGVPLYLEEFVGSVRAESRAGGRLPIPRSVHDLLLSGLDRAGAAKFTAQVASTFGREVVFDQLVRVSPLGAAPLRDHIAALLDAGVLVQPDEASDVYRFRHALLQEAAYASQLRAMRRERHAAIAEMLIADLEDGRTRRPEVLAHHLTESGSIARAVPFWLDAAQDANIRSANVESVAYLRRLLELLDSLPPSNERSAAEHRAQLQLAVSLQASEGFGSVAVAAAFDRAYALTDELEDSRQAQIAIAGVHSYQYARARFAEAERMARRGLAESTKLEIRDGSMHFHSALGLNLFVTGELEQARDHLVQAVEIHNTMERDGHDNTYAMDFGYQNDMGTLSLAYLAWVQTLLGDPQAGRTLTEEAIELATQRGHPNPLAIVHVLAGGFYMLFWRDEERARTLAARVSELVEEHNFFSWEISVGPLKHRANAETNPLAAREIANLLKLQSMLGAMIHRPLAEYWRAESHAVWAQANATTTARLRGARRLLESARHTGDATGERWLEPEIDRLQSALYYDCGDEAAGDAALDRAIAGAEKLGAPAWLLRSSILRAERQIQGGQRGLAIDTLRHALSGMVSGEGYPDSERARALLESLR